MGVLTAELQVLRHDLSLEVKNDLIKSMPCRVLAWPEVLLYLLICDIFHAIISIIYKLSNKIIFCSEFLIICLSLHALHTCEVS